MGEENEDRTVGAFIDTSGVNAAARTIQEKVEKIDVDGINSAIKSANEIMSFAKPILQAIARTMMVG